MKRVIWVVIVAAALSMSCATWRECSKCERNGGKCQDNGDGTVTCLTPEQQREREKNK